MARVTVGTHELEAAIERFQKETRRRSHLPDAELVIDARGLEIDCGGVGIVLGRGPEGEGVARLDGKTFGDLKQVMPPGDEVKVEIGDGFVRFGAMKLRAVTRREMPVEPGPLAERRFLDVVLSGYAEAPAAHEGRFSEDERFDAGREKERLVREAAQGLRALGVTEAQVREWVEEHLRRLAARPRRRR